MRGLPQSAIWPRLARAIDEGDLKAWLEIQCCLIPSARAGLLLLCAPGDNSYQPEALWPDEAADLSSLATIAERCIEERCGLVSALDDALDGVCYPIVVGDQLRGVVVLAVATTTAEDLQAAMGNLQWGSAFVTLHLERILRQDLEVLNKRLGGASKLLAEVLSEAQFQPACTRMVNGLASILNCDRVSLGFVYGQRVKVRMLSHSARFGQRMNLLKAIGAAMEECLDQRRMLMCPPSEHAPASVVLAQQCLCTETGCGAVLSIPLFREDSCYAVVTLERQVEQPFSDDTATRAESMATLAAAALEDKRLNDRWLITKTWQAALNQTTRLLGAGYPGRKLLLLALVLTSIFFAFTKGDYQVAADATLEGQVRRVITAPSDGFVRSAEVRAGDVANEGQVLATLDDREMRLEMLKWSSRRAQLRRQFQEAVGKRKRSSLVILKAQIAQTQAKLALAKNKLARSQIKAPFNGIIISGDLSQRLGTAVRQGDVLFEMAPLHRYRIILQVEEDQIDELHTGQLGHLLLTALPRQPLRFELNRITPVTKVVNGATRFKIEGRLLENSGQLRPGMVGIGKIAVDRRLLIGIWTRKLRNWLRLKLWAWGLQ